MRGLTSYSLKPVYSHAAESGSSSSLSFGRVSSAVIPVGGLGTRMLPLTNSTPKNMLTVGSKPLIEFAIEEALLAGCDSINIVCGPRDKEIYEAHFNLRSDIAEKISDPSKETIRRRVEAVTRHAPMLNFLVQEEPKGLGHAVLMAKDYVDGPFAVILPDDLMVEGTTPNTIRTMAQQYTGGMAIATMRVGREDVSKYGIFQFEEGSEDGVARRAVSMIEKPSAETAPSQNAAMGRYILPQSIMTELENTVPGKGGEIQLTDAIKNLCERGEETLTAVKFSGVRYDCGELKGFLSAQHEISGLLLRQLGLRSEPNATQSAPTPSA
jgi:UTP--glucose-1-phosphate uridylyltransferase